MQQQQKNHQNTAKQHGGGVCAIFASSIVVTSGARLEVINNTAVTFNGGGMFLQDQGTRLDVSGNGTQMIVQGNTAGKSGGSVYAAGSSSLLVSSGARLDVINNTAIQFGGGVILQNLGLLNIHHHQFEKQNY
jgi:predicted outer membrane repeat protein